MQILALEPWLGGSHRQFLEQWQRRSAHDVRVLGLAPRHWKWRMRASGWELARKVRAERVARPDVLLASDFVDLPAFYGHAPEDWSGVPAVVYFHENQLTYPEGPGAPRDLGYAFTNVVSCLRATRVVFNSHFHLDDFRAAADAFLAALPRPTPRAELARALDQALVVSPGVDFDEIPLGPGAGPGEPLRIVFNHRWEHDKDPVGFLRAVAKVVDAGGELDLVLLGERGGEPPPGAAELLERLVPRIVHDGFAASREAYARLLGESDVAVSTASHEYYGVAAVEALAAGCRPVLPDRLAYPELLAGEEAPYADPDELERRLAELAERPPDASERSHWRALAAPHSADLTAAALDRICTESLHDPGSQAFL